MTESVDDLMNRLRASREDPTIRLGEISGRLREIRARYAERVRNDPLGLPQEMIDALLAASGPDAPVECQRVRRLVKDGLLTWTELCADPEGSAGPEGRILVRRAQAIGRFGRASDEDITDPRDLRQVLSRERE